jgi:hypothetical protein
MSRLRRRQLRWSNHPAARRERNLSRHSHLNLSRQPRHHPQHLRQANRDHERRAAVAAAEVVAEVVHGRELLQPHLRSPQKLPLQEHPQ